MTQDFDVDVVKRAAGGAGRIGMRVRNAIEGAVESLSANTSMAGTDMSGQAFAASYTTAALNAMSLGAGAVGSCNQAADLLYATAVNHQNADRQSAINSNAAPAFPPGSYPSFAPPAVPSALGGMPEPSWWNQIAEYVEGEVWPNGDPTKLRNAANAWNVAANKIADEVTVFGLD